jgi:hypothetical protein
MHFIQEIRFLKAYYWANLGKFAFTPEDRIEWTERAKKDFELLGIPADTYCNPDPANIYYRGFQADLCAPRGSNGTESITVKTGQETSDASTSEDAGKNVPNEVA